MVGVLNEWNKYSAGMSAELKLEAAHPSQTDHGNRCGEAGRERVVDE